jgi:hypothetical protein
MRTASLGLMLQTSVAYGRPAVELLSLGGEVANLASEEKYGASQTRTHTPHNISQSTLGSVSEQRFRVRFVFHSLGS